jgi:hypothetical protein
VGTNLAGAFQNCFTTGYETIASEGQFTGKDPDTFVSTGGVAPINISSLLVPGAEQVKIDLQDEGFYLSNSTLYLNTNCTPGGVTGPALVSGNPIPAVAPTTAQLSQDFSFNPITNQQVGFGYDLTVAQTAGTLTVTNQTIPEVADDPLDPAIFQSTYVAQTSFATTSCLLHTGELLANGSAACKLYTLDCKVGTSPTGSGAECPISTQPNEIFQDEFDGPALTLNDIVTPQGTFHTGVGFLMAKEGWTGGPCTFDPAANLQGLDCPQNLLTSFTSTGVTPAVAKKAASASKSLAIVTPLATSSSSSGSYTSSGRTTHPNSTFITIGGVPEALTSVQLAGAHPGNWINTGTAAISFSAQPPNLAGATLAGVASFVASPIESITYGLSGPGAVPQPGNQIVTDTTVTNSTPCPATTGTPAPATVYNPAEQVISGLADGQYLLHYYAQDCAGTQELQFAQASNGAWSTSFYTIPVNVDTVAPTASIGPLSPVQTSYSIGEAVKASYQCTDATSGVVRCGNAAFAVGATHNTGTLTSLVNTDSPGPQTFTVQAVDAAGNQSSASVSYLVGGSYRAGIEVLPSLSTITYPGGTVVTVKVLAAPGTPHHSPRGTIVLQDGSTPLQTLALQSDGAGNGAAYFYVQGLNAGKHSLLAVYSGDAYNAGGISSPGVLTVLQEPVKLSLSCVNPTIVFGVAYNCKAYTTPILAGSNTVITYSLDGGAPITLPLTGGAVDFTLAQPYVGTHTLVANYASQGNYAAATSQVKTFTVTAAP